MIKLLFLLLISFNVYAGDDDGTCFGVVLDTSYGSPHTMTCEDAAATIADSVDYPLCYNRNYKEYENTPNGDQCTLRVKTTSYRGCNDNEDTFIPDFCPPDPNRIPPKLCLAKCEADEVRQPDGTCCTSPLGITCTADGWSNCSCAEGTELISTPDGDVCTPLCDAGFERDPVTNECIASCTLCDDAQAEASAQCTSAGTWLDTYTCTIIGECEGKEIIANCTDIEPCQECKNRESERQEFCRSNGAQLIDFQCTEDDITCEVLSYNQGTCLDDDSDPNDPNFGDGSQNNNDETNDVPDINNTASGNTTINNTTTTTNSDGSTTTSSTTGTNDITIEMPDYNPALEQIGDNIEDTTKAVNSQTEQLKDFQNVMDKALEDNTNKLKQIDTTLDDISDEISAKDSILPDFDQLQNTINNGMTSIETSIQTVQTTYNNVKTVLEGDIPVNVNRGNFNGFELQAWDNTITVDPCPMASKIAPFMTVIVDFMFLLWSVWVLVWGFKGD